MYEELLTRLVHETGCDRTFGGMLLRFTGGDVDGAVQIMRSVEKDIFVLKGKFIGQTSKYYGSFIIVFNTRLKSYHFIDMAAVKGDKSGIEFDFTKKWREYFDDIVYYKKRNIIDGDKCNRFITFLNTQKNIDMLELKLHSKRENYEEELNTFLTDILINSIGDVNVVLKLKMELTDVFELNKGIDNEALFIDENNSSVKEEHTGESEGKEILYLKIEPEISPVTGISISELEKGDLIAVKISDHRPVAEYIGTLLKARDEKTGESVSIYASLHDIEVVEHGVFLTVEFGPGIYGRSYFGEDVKVNIKKELTDKNGKKDEPAEKEGVLMKHFWIFGGTLFVVILGMLILIFYYNS